MEKLNLRPNSQLATVPEQGAIDYGIAVAKVATLAFPFLGPAVTLIDLLTAPARGRRMSDWCEEFRVRFNDMSQRVDGLTPEELTKNEAFISAFAQATQAALKTHQKEKLEALKNAVISVALGKEPDPNRHQQFLTLLDRFSETHLIVLRFLNDPESHLRKQGKTVPFIVQGIPKLLVNNLICDAMPSLRISSTEERTATSFQFIELILGDLVSARLVALERLNDTWAVPAFSSRPGGAPVQKMATHLGEDFLAFITASDPAKPKDS